MEQKHQICRDIEFFSIFHCYWGFEIFLLKREKTAFVVSVLIRINNASCNLSLFFNIFYFMKSCIAMSGKWYKFRTELFFLWVRLRMRFVDTCLPPHISLCVHILGVFVIIICWITVCSHERGKGGNKLTFFWFLIDS